MKQQWFILPSGRAAKRLHRGSAWEYRSVRVNASGLGETRAGGGVRNSVRFKASGSEERSEGGTYGLARSWRCCPRCSRLPLYRWWRTSWPRRWSLASGQQWWFWPSLLEVRWRLFHAGIQETKTCWTKEKGAIYMCNDNSGAISEYTCLVWDYYQMRVGN